MVEKAKKMETESEEKDKWKKVRKKSMMMQQNDMLRRENTNEKINLMNNNGKYLPNRGSESDELLGMFDESKVQIDEDSSENSYESYWEEEEVSE